MGTYKLSIDELRQDLICFISEREGDFSLNDLIKAVKRAWWHFEYYSKKSGGNDGP